MHACSYSYNAQQRGLPDSRGNSIDNPVEVIDCTSDLDSVTSETPATQLAPRNVRIKLARAMEGAGTTAVSAPDELTIKAERPLKMTDQELTEYADDLVPPPTRVEHANKGEPLSTPLEPH